MFWLFCLLTVAIIGELSAGHRPFLPVRKLLAVISIVSGLAASAGLLVFFPGIASFGLAVVSLYSSFNMLRAVAGKPKVEHLLPAINLTAVWFSLLKLLLAYALALTAHWQFAMAPVITVLAFLQVAIALAVTASVHRQLRATSPEVLTTSLPEKQWPSVSVLVAARNEGGQVEACLASALASNYPKLEIIALDDDSSDKTAEVIRSFAHSGVRFISGPEADAKGGNGWLPRNRANALLADAASGEYLLFAGSDVRLSPQAIRTLVASMASTKTTMMAVVPQNTVARTLPLVQAMRYFWELAPPRWLFRRPPVLSSCWIITRAELEQAGGFAAVRRSATPEAHFAHHALISGSGYGFVRSDGKLGISSEKSRNDQRETAIYSRYPQLHRRPEMAMFLTVAEVLVLTGIGFLWPVSWLVDVPLAAIVASAVATVLLAVSFARIQRQVFRRLGWLDGLGRYLPAIVADIYYVNNSMYCYEFGKVYRNGRDVSAQVRNEDRKG